MTGPLNPVPDDPANPPPPNPNPNPSDPPISPTDEAQLWKTAAQEANRRAEEMRFRLEQIEQRLNAPPPPPAPGSAGDPNKVFFDTPVDIIRKELRETIAPLTQFKEEYTRNQTLLRVKEEFRNDPRFKKVFDKAEHLIDNAMSRIDPTRENLFSALLGIIGAEASGMLPGISFRDTPPNPPPNPPSPPPHITPSPSPLPSATPAKPTRRELTEAERVEVRRLRMSEEEYLRLLESPADDFMTVPTPPGAPK